MPITSRCSPTGLSCGRRRIWLRAALPPGTPARKRRSAPSSRAPRRFGGEIGGRALVGLREVGRGYGKAADVASLKQMSREVADRIKGWCHVLYLDSGLAMILGIVVTAAFLISGAGILGVERIVPSNDDMAQTLSRVFSARWDKAGGFIFRLCGAVAMVSIGYGFGQVSEKTLSDLSAWWRSSREPTSS